MIDKSNKSNKSNKLPSFLILGMPRSGTTWLANWMMQLDEAIICYHDLIDSLPPEKWSQLFADVNSQSDTYEIKFGVSCTGSALFHESINELFPDVPKLIIHNYHEETVKSLSEMNPPRKLFHDAETWSSMLNSFDNHCDHHIQFKDLFSKDMLESIAKDLLGISHFSRIQEIRTNLLLMQLIQPEMKLVEKNYRNIEVLKGY